MIKKYSFSGKVSITIDTSHYEPGSNSDADEEATERKRMFEVDIRYFLNIIVVKFSAFFIF